MDILQLNGNVRLLTISYHLIPEELKTLCDSLVTNLYSRNDHLQHISGSHSVTVSRIHVHVDGILHMYR